jgi:hypothetical protein
VEAVVLAPKGLSQVIVGPEVAADSAMMPR